jgi:putative iron-regulated protein
MVRTLRRARWCDVVMVIVSLVAVVLRLASAQSAAAVAPADGEVVARCVRRYAEIVSAEYAHTLRSAESMRAAIRAFCDSPTEAGLSRARESWIAARDSYGRTEAFRFGNGPIDTRRGGVETFVNAWPVDEAYIEPADREARTGIIRDSARYPALGRAILRLHNQRGGETNVCTGWHAIEFMLWGADLSDDGPGARPVGDFVDAASPYAARRREFLLEVTDMLCEDLAKLDRAWAGDAGGGSASEGGDGQGANHRARFIADPRALRAILIGPALLAGFEMSGERLAVALETRDQEEEHSCFSDTTDRDFKANIRGIALVVRDSGAIEVVRGRDAARAQSLTAALDAAETAVDAMPAPFDRAMRAADGDPARKRLVAALEALEVLGEELDAAARLLGYELPAEPQG